jgi:hypothetical protein
MILVYRGTEHGFTAENFHSHCDNIPNTMTFVKSDMDRVFGGFASVPWSVEHYQDLEDHKAFIFSLTHRTIHE